MSKKPNKFLAPVVIVGVTIGFLASAYKFVFAKPENVKKGQAELNQNQQDASDSKES